MDDGNLIMVNGLQKRLQKDRAQTSIVIVTDERDNFDLSLANYDARLSILKIPGMKFEEAFVSIREHPQFGKGTIFIFSGGTHDLHTQVPFADCMNYGCPTPQFMLVNSLPGFDNHHLVSKALQLHLAILSSTTDDIALFCGLLPIIQHRYNIHVVHHRPCLSFHPAMYPQDCVIPNYDKIVNYFNIFSKYHAQFLGYIPWDLDAPKLVTPIQEILLPNCYNFQPVVESNRANHVKFLCNTLMTTLSSCIKNTHLTQEDYLNSVNGVEVSQEDGLQNKPPSAITVPNVPTFNEVYFIGRRESVSMLSECNVKSTLIYHNFNSNIDLDVNRVLNKIGKITEKSICCLVFDLAVITKTMKSPHCHKYSCEESLAVSTLQHSVGNLKELEISIDNVLQSIEKFAGKLSIHIPVLILPLAPMRIFCDDNDFQIHRIGHTVNTMGFSVVDGSKSLWQKALQYITNSWISFVKEANRKYDMYNYISNFVENNKDVFSILDYVSDFLTDWKEQLHWKSFLYSSLSCIVIATPNYVENIDLRLSINCDKRSSRPTSRVRSRSKSSSLYRRSHSRTWLEDERSGSPSFQYSGKVEKDSVTYYNRISSPQEDQHELRFRSHQTFRQLNSRSKSRSRSSSWIRSQAFISSSLNNSRSQSSHRKSRSLSRRRSRSISLRRSGSLSQGRAGSLSRGRAGSLSRRRSGSLSRGRAGSLSRRRSRSINNRSGSLSRRRSRSINNRRSGSLCRKRSRSLSRRGSRSLSRRRSRSIINRRSRSLNRRKSRSLSCIKSRLLSHRRSSSSRRSEAINQNIVSKPVSHKRTQKSFSHIRTSQSTNQNKTLKSGTANKKTTSSSRNKIQKPPIHDRMSKPSQNKIPLTSSHNKELRIKNQHRSRSKSYTPKPGANFHTQHSSKSGSKRVGSRPRSVSPPIKKSKGVVIKYQRRSELDSHTSKPCSRSKSPCVSRNSKPHTMTAVQPDPKISKHLPRNKVLDKPCTSTTRKRSHSKSISPFWKRSRTTHSTQQPMPSLLPESTQTSLKTLNYTEDELRHKFGTELFEVYASELKEVQYKFDEEFEAFRSVPEFLPNFESYYERFVDKYSSQYKNKDEQYKDALWRVFWKSNFDLFKKEEFLIRQQKLIEDFETTEALLLRNSKTSPKNESKQHTPFSFEAALSLIEKLSEDILYLGPSIKAIIIKARTLGTTSKEAYSVFTNSDNLEVLNFVFNKFKSLSHSSDEKLHYMYNKAVEWIPLVIEEAKREISKQLKHKADDAPIDLNAIAKVSLGQSTEFTIDLIQTALAYEGIGDPSTQLINELFMKVCALHFKLKSI